MTVSSAACRLILPLFENLPKYLTTVRVVHSAFNIAAPLRSTGEKDCRKVTLICQCISHLQFCTGYSICNICILPSQNQQFSDVLRAVWWALSSYISIISDSGANFMDIDSSASPSLLVRLSQMDRRTPVNILMVSIALCSFKDLRGQARPSSLPRHCATGIRQVTISPNPYRRNETRRHYTCVAAMTNHAVFNLGAALLRIPELRSLFRLVITEDTFEFAKAPG